MKPIARLFACLLGLGTGLSSQADVIGPQLFINANFGDGSVFQGTQELVRNPSGPGWLLPASVRVLHPNTQAEELLLQSASLDFDSDPFAQLTVGLTDFGTPTTFTVTINVPLILAPGVYTYTLDGTTTVTDADGNGVDITSTSMGGQNGLYFGLVDSLVVEVSGVSQNDLATGATYAPAQKSGSASCAVCTFFGAAIGMTGSGGGDQYNDFVRFGINESLEVPAPTTLALLGLGLVALGLMRRPARA